MKAPNGWVMFSLEGTIDTCQRVFFSSCGACRKTTAIKEQKAETMGLSPRIFATHSLIRDGPGHRLLPGQQTIGYLSKDAI